MSSYQDPDVQVSIVAVILFLNAVLIGLQLVLPPLVGGTLPALLPLLVAATSAVGGAGLLRGRRWAWPTALAAAILDVVFSMLTGRLLGLLFDALVIFLLTRPEVRAKFGVR